MGAMASNPNREPMNVLVASEPMPMTSDLKWSEMVAIAPHKHGAFAFRADGTYEKVENPKDTTFWHLMSKFGAVGLALPGSRVVTFGKHSHALFDMEKQTMTILGQCRWDISNGTNAIVRPLSSSDTVLLFHDKGLLSFNIKDGGNGERLAKEGWKSLKSLVVDPEKDIAYAFNDDGVYKVNYSPKELVIASEKINDEDWSQTRCAVWTPMGILVLHSSAIYRLDVETGKSMEVVSEGWAQATHAVDAGDGTALVFHSDGLFKLSLSDASYSKVGNAGSWPAFYGIWVAKPETRYVNIAH